MTNTELTKELLIYKSIVKQICNAYLLDEGEYYRKAKSDMKNVPILSKRQSGDFASKLGELMELTHHKYDYIEFKKEPTEHTRLICVNTSIEDGDPYTFVKEERFDTIYGKLFSWQTNVFETNVRYSVAGLWDQGTELEYAD